MSDRERLVYTFGPFRLVPRQGVLLRADRVVRLPPKAVDLLVELVRAGGRVVAKSELLDRVWSDTFVEEGVLAKNVSLLRKALGGSGYVETLAKRGYRFAAEVAIVEDDDPELGVRRGTPGEDSLSNARAKAGAVSAGALPSQSTNLPREATSFVGREHEVARLTSELASICLLTLTGPGGIGKSRLASRVAIEARAEYPDGIWLVELAPLGESGLVAHAVASACGAGEVAGRTVMESLVARLAKARALLIFDNCEHVVESCAETAFELMRACPRLTILATSREALHVPGETIRPVAPLSLPDPGVVVAERVVESEAVRLFSERARLARRDFAITDENAAAVTEICRRLDGLPLAIELAAARVRTLPVRQILDRLSDRLGLLADASRTTHARHRTVRAALDWSYDLLTETQRTALERLSVVRGGCTLEAAEAICADAGADERAGGEGRRISADEVLEALTDLVDRSLVGAGERDGRAWFTLLETVRQYAGEKLARAGGEASARDRHADYFARLAAEGASHEAGSGQVEWIRTIEPNHDNFRAALEWTLGRGAADARALALCCDLNWFWLVCGHWREARRWFDRALETASEGAPPLLRARVLHEAANLALRQADVATARRLYESSLELRAANGDAEGRARTLNNLGVNATDAGDLERAYAYHLEALEAYRDLDNRGGMAIAITGLGGVEYRRENTSAAVAHYEEAIGLLRAADARRSVGVLLFNLAVIHVDLDEYDRGEPFLAEAVEIAHDVSDKALLANATHMLAEISRERGNSADALARLGAALDARLELGDRVGVGWAFELYSRIALAAGRLDRAGRMVGAARSQFAATGFEAPPKTLTRLAATAATVADLLGASRAAALEGEGHALSVDDAVAEARRIGAGDDEAGDDGLVAFDAPRIA